MITAPSCTCCGECVVFEDTFENLDNWETPVGNVTIVDNKARAVGGAITSIASDASGGRVTVDVVADMDTWTSVLLICANPADNVELRLVIGDVDGSPCGSLEVNQGGSLLTSRALFHHMLQDGNALKVQLYWNNLRVIAFVVPVTLPHDADNRVNLAVDLPVPIGDVQVALKSVAAPGAPGSPGASFDNFEWLKATANGAECYNDDICRPFNSLADLPLVFGDVGDTVPTELGGMYWWNWSTWYNGSTPITERCDAIITDDGVQDDHPVKIEVQAAYVTDNDRQGGYTVLVQVAPGRIPYATGEYLLASLIVGDHELKLFGVTSPLGGGPSKLHIRYELYQDAVLIDDRTPPWVAVGPDYYGGTTIPVVSFIFGLAFIHDIVCVKSSLHSTSVQTVFQTATTTTQDGGDVIVELFPDFINEFVVGLNHITQVLIYRCWTCAGCHECLDQRGTKEFIVPLQVSVVMPGHLSCDSGTFVCDWIGDCQWSYRPPTTNGVYAPGILVTYEEYGTNQSRWYVVDERCADFLPFFSTPVSQYADCDVVDLEAYYENAGPPPTTLTAYITAL